MYTFRTDDCCRMLQMLDEASIAYKEFSYDSMGNVIELHNNVQLLFNSRGELVHIDTKNDVLYEVVVDDAMCRHVFCTTTDKHLALEVLEKVQECDEYNLAELVEQSLDYSMSYFTYIIFDEDNGEYTVDIEPYNSDFQESWSSNCYVVHAQSKEEAIKLYKERKKNA